MFEKRYASILPRLFVANGQANGQIELADTTFFKVKQRVVVTADTEPNLELEVKAVLSDTILVVGPQNSNIKQITNISAYTVAKNAAILADEQVRPGITFDEIHRAVYDEEPTAAYRSVFVDRWGRYYDAGNPLHVQLSDGSVNIGTVNADLDVQLTDKESAPGEADYDIVRVGNGINELDIEDDGSINVNITPISNPEIFNIDIDNANEEETIPVPAGTKRFKIKLRSGNAKAQFSYVENESGSNFMTLEYGCFYEEQNVVLSNLLNIYIRVNKPNQVVELLVWS